MCHFDGVGIIKNKPNFDSIKLDFFMNAIIDLREKKFWQKEDILKLFNELLPEFTHKETGKNLDQRM